MSKKTQETLKSNRIKKIIDDNPNASEEISFEPTTETEIMQDIDNKIQNHEKEIAKKLADIRKIRQEIAILRKDRKELRFVRIRVPAEKKKLVEEKIKDILKQYGGDLGGA
ncbi:hypothetical protein GQ473_01945 [archaeon]|nr:hypothetical protein [archaeon]